METHVALDALALEYKRDYGTARGNLDIANLVNNPAANGVCSVFGLRLTKEVGDLITSEAGVLFDYRPYPTLITQHAVQPLSE